MEATIYKLLSASKRTAKSLYHKLLKVHGLWCTVKRPIDKGSIFGLEDLVDYDELAETRERLLISGLFKEGTRGMIAFDTFIEDVYVLTLCEDQLELQTQIEVDFCGAQMTFKVDDHKNVTPELCGPLFIKNILVPAT